MSDRLKLHGEHQTQNLFLSREKRTSAALSIDILNRFCSVQRRKSPNEIERASRRLVFWPGWDLCSVKSTEKSTVSLNVEMSFGGEPCGLQDTCCLHEALSPDSYPYRLLSDNTKCEPFEKNPMTYQIIVGKTKTAQCSLRWVRCSDAIFLYAQLLLFVFLIISHIHNRFRISPWNQLVSLFLCLELKMISRDLGPVLVLYYIICRPITLKRMLTDLMLG